MVSSKTFIMALLKYCSLFLLLLGMSSFTPMHHGWANYDQETVLDFTSKIQQPTYENPHSTIKAVYKDQVWLVILAPATRMKDRGITADMLKKDLPVRIVAYPHKKIKDEMRAERIYIGDKKYELR